MKPNMATEEETTKASKHFWEVCKGSQEVKKTLKVAGGKIINFIWAHFNKFLSR